jgi:hypothetical protein
MKFSFVLVLALMLIGCATTQIKGHTDLLNFIADGKTTKEEILLKLGQPSGKFKDEKILTYRLGFDSRNGGYYVVEREFDSFGEPVWIKSKYSLVLIFDGQNILRKHSLVEVTR